MGTIKEQIEQMPGVLYDERADVLYLSIDNQPALSFEVLPGVLVRRGDNGHLVGLTIIDFVNGFLPYGDWKELFQCPEITTSLLNMLCWIRAEIRAFGEEDE